MCVQFKRTVKVAEWPPFGKERFTRFTVRSDSDLLICILVIALLVSTSGFGF